MKETKTQHRLYRNSSGSILTMNTRGYFKQSSIGGMLGDANYICPPNFRLPCKAENANRSLAWFLLQLHRKCALCPWDSWHIFRTKINILPDKSLVLQYVRLAFKTTALSLTLFYKLRKVTCQLCGVLIGDKMSFYAVKQPEMLSGLEGIYRCRHNGGNPAVNSVMQPASCNLQLMLPLWSLQWSVCVDTRS